MTRVAWTTAAPVITALAMPERVNDGDLVSITVDFQDAGLLDEHELTIQWGDGTPDTVASIIAGTRTATVQHRFFNDIGPAGDSAFVVRVIVSDGISQDAQESQIVVGAPNVAPTDISLSNSTLIENTPTNEDLFVGSLSTSDPNPIDQHHYELVSGTGDGHNDDFVISGAGLFLKQGTTLDHESRPQLQLRIASIDAAGNRTEKPLVVNVTDLAEVIGVSINEGENHRSRVSQLTVEFDQEVTPDNAAFRLTHLDPPEGLPEAVDLVIQTIVDADGKSRARLTFTGPYVDATGSLITGRYLLTVNGNLIRSVVGNQAVDGDANGTPGGLYQFGAEEADQFFRFFGDSDGDGDVDGQDYGRFGLTFFKSAGEEGFNPEFDYDNDGDVDGLDYGQFRLRFLRKI